MHGGVHLCTCVGMHMCVYRCIYVLLSVGMWVYVCVWAWVCISVCFCLSTCMWYECIYVWGMHICTCTHLCTWIGVWLCVVDVYMSGWVELHVGVCGRIDACVCAEVCTPSCGVCICGMVRGWLCVYIETTTWWIIYIKIGHLYKYVDMKTSPHAFLSGLYLWEFPPRLWLRQQCFPQQEWWFRSCQVKIQGVSCQNVQAICTEKGWWLHYKHKSYSNCSCTLTANGIKFY